MFRSKVISPILLSLLLALLQSAHALDKKPTSGGTGLRHRTSGTDSEGAFKSPCGTKEQVARRTAECLESLFEIMGGRFEKVPKSGADIIPVCDKFAVCEKCLRAVAKDCLPGGGVHKVAVGAFASSIVRFRRQECKTDAARQHNVPAMKCLKDMGSDVDQVLRNETVIAGAINNLKITPEAKVVRLCCLLNEIDREVAVRTNRRCPELTEQILGLVHSVTDDAKSTLCMSNKCQGSLNGLAGKSRAGQASQLNLIEPVMEILLSITTE